MLKAKLVVAADGRNSRLAALAEVPTRLSENRRGGVFAHYRHVATGRGERSLMWITPRGVGYVFQNDDNVCVVTAMPDKDDWASFDADPEEALLSFLAKQCDPADFSKAERVSEFIKVKDYPNQSRAPVYAGMALIGDAALSADPLFGVGCGWAFATAEQLVNATSAALAEPAALARGLKAYARYHRWFLGGHRLVIEDFSKRRDINTFERLVYRAAARDRRFAEHFYRFGMRIDSLAAFMSPWPMLRMLWLNLTAGRPGKTSPVPSQPA